MNILLVDDDSFILNFVGQILQQRDHAVLTGNNGQDLLQQVLYTKFDLVITDNDMPLICGVDALRVLRNNQEFDRLPVIVHTGNTSEELRRSVEDLNGIFIPKEAYMINLFVAVDNINRIHV